MKASMLNAAIGAAQFAVTMYEMGGDHDAAIRPFVREFAEAGGQPDAIEMLAAVLQGLGEAKADQVTAALAYLFAETPEEAAKARVELGYVRRLG